MTFGSWNAAGASDEPRLRPAEEPVAAADGRSTRLALAGESSSRLHRRGAPGRAVLGDGLDDAYDDERDQEHQETNAPPAEAPILTTRDEPHPNLTGLTRRSP
jgi:hypothetical protein